MCVPKVEASFAKKKVDIPNWLNQGLNRDNYRYTRCYTVEPSTGAVSEWQAASGWIEVVMIFIVVVDVIMRIIISRIDTRPAS